MNIHAPPNLRSSEDPDASYKRRIYKTLGWKLSDDVDEQKHKRSIGWHIEV